MSQEEQYRKIAKNTVTLGGVQVIQMGITLVRAKVVAILAAEAHAIIDSWGNCELTVEEDEIVPLLCELEENPYPNCEVKD